MVDAGNLFLFDLVVVDVAGAGAAGQKASPPLRSAQRIIAKRRLSVPSSPFDPRGAVSESRPGSAQTRLIGSNYTAEPWRRGK